MAVDKDLFMYDLAIVAIMKNEAPYVKEWIEYHVLAGVQHFYIYDNESPDNLKEALQPYIDAGIVTYKFYPGTGRQCEAYNEAIQKYRFFCRYMAFVDADEFIFPQENKSIVEITDKLLDDEPYAGGLVVNWMMYGSNNLETADYSRGVLERFTRRAEQLSVTIKTIANPRRVDYLFTPHYMIYFEGYEQFSAPDKIIMNHYKMKSREEYERKSNKFVGDVAYGNKDYYNSEGFSHERDNDVEDNSILVYRDARWKVLSNVTLNLSNPKLTESLSRTLGETFDKKYDSEKFDGKLETFLTCRKLAEYLREEAIEENAGNFFEEAALNAVYKSLRTGNITFGGAMLLLSEIPDLLPLKYPVLKNIYKICMEILPQIKNSIQKQIKGTPTMMRWKDFTRYDYLLRLLKNSI